MIRPATAVDAAAIARLEVRAWHRAYADWVDVEQMAGADERTDRWRERLSTNHATVVYALDAVVAGFAAVGPGRDVDLEGSVGELMALYVDPPAQGAGVGGVLLEAATDLLRAEGYATAVLWVFAANGHARELYQRRGWWSEDGVERHELGARELRYRRTL